MFLNTSLQSFAFTSFLKIQRERAGHTSCETAYHIDGATTEKAWFRVDILLISLGVAILRNEAWEAPGNWVAVLRRDDPTGIKVPTCSGLCTSKPIPWVVHIIEFALCVHVPLLSYSSVHVMNANSNILYIVVLVSLSISSFFALFFFHPLPNSGFAANGNSSLKDKI